jgi:hypothetical protein
MSAYSTGFLFADESTSLAVDSPASRSRLLEKDSAQPTLGLSGRSSVALFQRFNRASSWAKTFAACLVTAGDWHSTQCVLTWKLKATKFSRFYFQLSVSVRPTSATGFGLWPTPLANDAKNYAPFQAGKNRNSPTLATYASLLPTPRAEGFDAGGHRGKLDSIHSVVKAGLLPTPTATMEQQSRTYFGGNLTLGGALLPTPTVAGNHNRKGASPNSGDGLSTAIKGLLPTPCATDHKRGAAPVEQTASGRYNRAQPTANGRPMGAQLTGIAPLLGEASQASGSLNPRFVAQMMGFPPDYCELDSPWLPATTAPAPNS